jgi:hypothetical protein
MVERFGATAIDYRAGDFVAAVHGRPDFRTIAFETFSSPSAKVWNWHKADICVDRLNVCF